MPRILLIALLILALASCWAAPAAAPPPDSKAWGKVSTTTGPPRPGAAEEQRAKLAGLDPLVPGRQPGAAGRAPRARSLAELPSPERPRAAGTSRTYTGPELAACEARIRAKLEASARGAPAARSLAGLTAPPKSAAAPVPRASSPDLGPRTPPVTRTEIPGTPLNDEQRAKLARSRAAVRPAPDRP